MDISKFRHINASSDTQIVAQNNTLRRNSRSKLGQLKDRVVAWHQGRNYQNQGVSDAKNIFMQALAKAEGGNLANLAMAKVKGQNWLNDDTKPMTKRDVTKIMDKARQLRMDRIKVNKHNAGVFVNRTMVDDLRQMGYGRQQIKDIKDIFMQKVNQHPDFSKDRIHIQPDQNKPNQSLSEVAVSARNEFIDQKAQQFAQGHPGLSQLGTDLNLNGIRDESYMGRIDEALRQINYSDTDENSRSKIRSSAVDAMTLIQVSQKHIGMPDFNLQNAVKDRVEMQNLSQSIHDVRGEIQNMLLQNNGNQQEATILNSLAQELQQLETTLGNKHDMLGQALEANPKSERNVQFAELTYLQCGLEALNDKLAQLNAVDNPDAQKIDAVQNLIAQFEDNIDGNQIAYIFSSHDEEASNDTIKSVGSMGKTMLKEINDELKNVGVSISKHEFHHARDETLNTVQEWAPIIRTIVKDGSTSESTINPALNLRDNDTCLSLVAKQLDNAGLRGISAHTDVNHSDHTRIIPNNLQHSKLDVDGETKVDMLRHGVIRTTEQAESVVSTSMWSDPALRQVILDRHENNDDTPINFDFNNVNLMSSWNPDNLFIKVAGTDKRREMQDDHIRAFNQLALQPQPCDIPFVDEQGNQFNVSVNLNVSVIPIPVNAAVTGATDDRGAFGFGKELLTPTSSLWEHIDPQILRGLESLAGDMGDPELGFDGSARGTTVGGMIGNVMSKLEEQIQTNPNNVDELKKMKLNLQESVDIIRDIYCSGSHKENDGNRYKFALATMFASSLAKQAHATLNLSNAGNGFGSSQGCMSNKDRGGNADAMLKSLNMSADSAFKLLRFNPDSHAQISPNELASMVDQLPPEDGANLLIIGLLYTGQLEAQQMQTLFMGSKNAKDLMGAIKQNPEAYPLLEGLSSYVKA